MKEELLKIASESLSSDEVSEIVKEKFMNALVGAIEDAFRWGDAKHAIEEKVKEVMEMLRDAYIGMPIAMQNVDISEDVAREFERLKKCGIMVRTENQPSKIECISNAIFQFPAEEELE